MDKGAEINNSDFNLYYEAANQIVETFFDLYLKEFTKASVVREMIAKGADVCLTDYGDKAPLHLILENNKLNSDKKNKFFILQLAVALLSRLTLFLNMELNLM
ncbi:MAG: hypothetical protein KC505_04365 [Myxococcales bacterium]|nr:hypothetical protein [Myxococcales bacterium]USN51215.1 MAG: hypothetical protein H6731_02050 [Myxococcales bacterium]